MPQIVIFKPGNCYPPLNPQVGIGFDRLRLKPGANHISDEQFNALTSHPSYLSYVERKALIVHHAEKEVQAVPLSETPANLAGYNVDDAEDIIDNTHDIDVLKRWLNDEPRKTARTALNQRIKDLQGGEA